MQPGKPDLSRITVTGKTVKSGRESSAWSRRSSQAAWSGWAAVLSRISHFSPSSCPVPISNSWPMRPAVGAWSGQT